VTALEALREAARTAGALVYRPVDAPAPDVCLPLCDGCTYALMEDLDNLFAPATRDGTYRLGDSNVYGCTFSEGTPDTCALHAFLHDGARCTEGI
jgi:hypothetical protein